MHVFVTSLAHLNSSMNPLVYLTFNLTFRKAFKNLLLNNISCLTCRYRLVNAPLEIVRNRSNLLQNSSIPSSNVIELLYRPQRHQNVPHCLDPSSRKLEPRLIP